MGVEKWLQFAALDVLEEMEEILRGAATTYPYIGGANCALRRMAGAAAGPCELGYWVRRIPASLRSPISLRELPYCPPPPCRMQRRRCCSHMPGKPSFAAVYKSGERVEFPSLQDSTRAVATLQDCAAMSGLLAGKCAQSGGLKYLEAGLPSEILRSIEILDVPADYFSLLGCGVDAAIWTTASSRAWGEFERAQWARLPRTIRSRSLLAVTFCDHAAGADNDLKRLRAKLEVTAKPYFQGICFVANGDLDLAAAASRNKALFGQIQLLAQLLAAERFGKAMAVAHRVMAKDATKTRTGFEHDGLRHTIAAEANKDLAAALKHPLSEGGLARPAILLNGHAYGVLAKTAAPGMAPANYSASADTEAMEQRPRRAAMIGAAAAAVAALAILVAIQPGLISSGQNSVPVPLLSVSGAMEQIAAQNPDKIWNAETEDGAAGTQRGGQVEIAAAEEHGIVAHETTAGAESAKGQAEVTAIQTSPTVVAQAIAAGEQRGAQTEAAAATQARNRPDTGRRSREVVKAALRAGGPIMHGVSQ